MVFILFLFETRTTSKFEAVVSCRSAVVWLANGRLLNAPSQFEARPPICTRQHHLLDSSISSRIALSQHPINAQLYVQIMENK